VLNGTSTGWYTLDPCGNYGTDYLKRAVINYSFFGANRRTDVFYYQANHDIYTGKSFDASATNYTMHFAAAKVPVKAFWSITLYNGAGFLVENPIGIYAIGDRTNVTRNADGSFDIYVQTNSPGGAKQANWLPAPSGPFTLIGRFYWADEPAFNSWIPPPVKGSS